MFDAEVAAASSRYGVSPALVRAVIQVESGGNPRALNTSDPGSAWGLMQMIPTTARGLGYYGSMSALLDDPALAVDLGTKLLAENLGRTGGNIPDAISAYNGGFRPALGFGRVQADGTYRNQAYVDKVLAAMGTTKVSLGLMLGLGLWFLSPRRRTAR